MDDRKFVIQVVHRDKGAGYISTTTIDGIPTMTIGDRGIRRYDAAEAAATMTILLIKCPEYTSLIVSEL